MRTVVTSTPLIRTRPESYHGCHRCARGTGGGGASRGPAPQPALALGGCHGLVRRKRRRRPRLRRPTPGNRLDQRRARQPRSLPGAACGRQADTRAACRLSRASADSHARAPGDIEDQPPARGDPAADPDIAVRELSDQAMGLGPEAARVLGAAVSRRRPRLLQRQPAANGERAAAVRDDLSLGSASATSVHPAGRENSSQVSPCRCIRSPPSSDGSATNSKSRPNSGGTGASPTHAGTDHPDRVLLAV